MAIKLSPYSLIEAVANRRYKKCGLKLRTIELENFHIQYWDSENDKPALVLLQAFAAEGKYTWLKQVKSLYKKYRLIVPNLIYFGESSMHPKSYNVHDQVRAMRLLIESLGIESYLLCGASYGGVIATELCMLHKNRVTKMVLTNAPLKFTLTEDTQPIMDEINVEAEADLLVPKNPRHLRKLFMSAYYSKPPIPFFVFKSVYKNVYADVSNKTALLNTFLHYKEEIRDKIFDLDLPILMIWGKEDRMAPIRIAYQLKEHFGSNASIVEIPKAAHMPNYERPATYNKVLTTFLGDEG